jgi:hypothetical protein
MHWLLVIVPCGGGGKQPNIQPNCNGDDIDNSTADTDSESNDESNVRRISVVLETGAEVLNENNENLRQTNTMQRAMNV